MATYLTEAQFCEGWRVAPRSAQRWRVTGDGPPFVRVGPRRILYRLEEVERWAFERTSPHRAAALAAQREARSARRARR